MSNKRMKIENLENLQELTTEEFSSVQGGLSIIIGPEHEFPIEWKPNPIHFCPKPKPEPLPWLDKPIEDHISIDLKHDEIKKIDITYVGWWCPYAL